MASESSKPIWIKHAQEDVDKHRVSHESHMVESRRSGREAIAWGASLVLTGAANVVDSFVDYIPTHIHPYTLAASAISGIYAVSGFVNFKYEASRAAKEAKAAIAISLHNEIALPEWTHPYIAQNQELFEHNLALTKQPELPC